MVGSKKVAVVIAVLVLAGAAAWWYFQPTTAPQPNVVVFLLDTVRPDGLGCYGRAAGPTPNVDALAGDGVRFEQAVSTSGWTLPSAASLMTATWPTIHGAMGKGIQLTPMRQEVPTAAELLKQAGFETVGFANAAFVSPMLGMDRGFDVFDHRYSYNWDTRRADETIDAAITELRKRRSKATFYFIHLFDPHLDYNPPHEYATKYTAGRKPALPVTMDDILELHTGADGRQPPAQADQDFVRALYDGELDFTDHNIGRFVDELKSLGLYDQATIVVTADHGEEFWEHDGFEHGHTLYDELVHIPLIIKFPAARALTGRSYDEQVRIIDVMPTVFETLGVTPPPSFIGESLLSRVGGRSGKNLSALCESTLYGAPRIALRGARYKYIQEVGPGANTDGELYDWKDDPGETNDLSQQMPRIRDQLRSELMELYTANLTEAGTMSKLKPVNLHPDRIKQLRSLGYVR